MKNKEKYEAEILTTIVNGTTCQFKRKHIRQAKDYLLHCDNRENCAECNRKTAQWFEEECAPDVDWTQVPMNTVIEVRDDEYATWNTRTFIFYDKDSDFPFICIGNATPQYDCRAVGWKYARLKKEE